MGKGIIDMDNLLDSSQVATKLNMSRVWVYKQVERGLLPFYRIGDAIRFDPREIDSYVNERRMINHSYDQPRNPKGRGRKKRSVHLAVEQVGEKKSCDIRGME